LSLNNPYYRTESSIQLKELTPKGLLRVCFGFTVVF
jgi:hypothetical protein